MEAYAWTSWGPAAGTLAVLLGVLVAARLLEGASSRVAVPAAWGVFAVGVTAVGFAVAREPAGTRMLTFCSATFLGMKAVVLAAARGEGAARLPLGRWLLFTLAWFGMQPRAFSRRRRGGDARALAWRGLRNAGMGAGCIVVARALGGVSDSAPSSVWAVLLLALGLSLLVHFGVFTLLTAAFTSRGYAVRVPFDAPLRARSPAEFWARRWNRGFAEMTSLAVHRPLRARLGARGAYLAAFVVSGLLHEVAISLPVRAGYGLPTLYFALQGLLAWHAGARLPRLVGLLLIVLPLPLVFHPWFVAGVLTPLLR